MSVVSMVEIDGRYEPYEYRCDRCGFKEARQGDAKSLPFLWSCVMPGQSEQEQLDAIETKLRKGWLEKPKADVILHNPTFDDLDRLPRHYCRACRRATTQPSEN